MRVRGGYPSQIAEFDIGDLDMCLNNAVWDIQRGNLLKLAEGKLITRAYHGRRALSVQELT